MMLSKIIISITIFFAVCFRSSVSIDLKSCTNDQEFLNAVQDFIEKPTVPIIVTVDPESADDKTLMKNLRKKMGFEHFIRLDVYVGDFSIAYKYLRYGVHFPELYVMRSGYLLKRSWTTMSSDSIDAFLTIALNSEKNDLHETTIADVMKDKISLRNKMFQPINRNQLGSADMLGLIGDTNPQDSPPSVTGPERKSESPPPVESQPMDRSSINPEAPLSKKQKGKQPFYEVDEAQSRKAIKIETPSPYQGNQHQTLRLLSRNPDYDSEKSTSS